jgi:predicted porin
MKKSLLALAALTAFAGVASAQSSVTMFGVLDAGYGYTKNSGKNAAGVSSKSAQGIQNSGYNSSRLGFQGIEDLGGGLKAGFWIEGQLYNDTGGGNAEGGDPAAAGTNDGLDFQRRSTVSLMGGFGEIRLGRDYSPEFMVQTIYDPFGTNGVGQGMFYSAINRNATLTAAGAAANSGQFVRTNNTIQYFTPAGLGGFGAHLMYGFGESSSAADGNSSDAGQYIGARLFYAAGPLRVDASYGQYTEINAASGGAGIVDRTPGGKYTVYNIGAWYDLGVVRPILFYQHDEIDNALDPEMDTYAVGLWVPTGANHRIRALYEHHDLKGPIKAIDGADYDKLSVGFLYDMSKRTTLYTTLAYIDNDTGSMAQVASQGVTKDAAGNSGKGSVGFEIGIRHSF